MERLAPSESQIPQRISYKPFTIDRDVRNFIETPADEIQNPRSNHQSQYAGVGGHALHNLPHYISHGDQHHYTTSPPYNTDINFDLVYPPLPSFFDRSSCSHSAHKHKDLISACERRADQSTEAGLYN